MSFFKLRVWLGSGFDYYYSANLFAMSVLSDLRDISVVSIDLALHLCFLSRVRIWLGSNLTRCVHLAVATGVTLGKVVFLRGLGFEACQWGFPPRRSGKKEWGLFLKFAFEEGILSY